MNEPLDRDDPGTAHASRVHARHVDDLLELPNYVGSGVSRHEGRSIIVVFVSDDNLSDDAPAELEGIRVFYKKSEPLVAARGS